MNTSIEQIKADIITGRWSNGDLDGLAQAVRFARSQLTSQIKRSITIGDTVEFTGSRTGLVLRGLVTKVAIKFVTVKTGQGLWKVPANMLTKVADLEPA